MNSFSGGIFKRVLFTTGLCVLVAGLSACGEPVEKVLEAKAGHNTRVKDVALVEPASLIVEAQALHDKSMSQSHGWTTTQPMIDKARAAMNEGDTDTARELAERALSMATAAVEQGKTEATAWKARVPQ